MADSSLLGTQRRWVWPLPWHWTAPLELHIFPPVHHITTVFSLLTHQPTGSASPGPRSQCYFLSNFQMNILYCQKQGLQCLVSSSAWPTLTSGQQILTLQDSFGQKKWQQTKLHLSSFCFLLLFHCHHFFSLMLWCFTSSVPSETYLYYLISVTVSKHYWIYDK